ncbi:MAG: hypothetical protein IJ168_09080 [Eubacterium sp.]|nr:hypothetical protein [Eubacterium sp.]
MNVKNQQPKVDTSLLERGIQDIRLVEELVAPFFCLKRLKIFVTNALPTCYQPSNFDQFQPVQKIRKSQCLQGLHRLFLDGTPEGTRTPDLLVRRMARFPEYSTFVRIWRHCPDFLANILHLALFCAVLQISVVVKIVVRKR